MDFLAHARRRAFSLWLRTGRVPRWARGGTTEVKYNPWHDPDDGRFTFAGNGRYFGRGRSGGSAKRSLDAGMADRPKEPFGGFAGGEDSFPGSGASGSWTPNPDTQRNRTQQPAKPTTRGPAGETPSATIERYARVGQQRRAAIDHPRNWRRVEANGYIYRIDAWGRTRRVSGTLVENPTQQRSRTAQREAGGPDRRRSDHGGHYIARRFNGPTQAFNHFAQDANFNRQDYGELENQWGRAIRAGKRVQVKIDPIYDGRSRRPSTIVVSFWIDGVKRRVKFPNEPRERTSAR